MTHFIFVNNIKEAEKVPETVDRQKPGDLSDQNAFIVPSLAVCHTWYDANNPLFLQG